MGSGRFLRLLAALAGVLIATNLQAADRHVRDYGNNVQNASDACSTGDVLHFDGLTQTVSFTPRSAVTYIGEGAKLTAPSGKAVMQFNVLANVDISGFTFVGNGINGVSLATANIHGNTFSLTGNVVGVYIWVGAPPDSSKANPAAWNATCPATCTNVSIVDNSFEGPATYAGQCEPIHCRFDTPAPPGPDNGPGKSKGNIIARNRMVHVSRTGIELQGGSTGSIVEDNIFDQPVLTGNPSIDSGSMAYSLAWDASVGAICRRNIARGPAGVTTGIEFAGHSGICQDNDIEGTNASIVVQTGSNGNVSSNRIVGARAMPAVGGTHPGLTMGNNSATVALDWDPARSWPITIAMPPPMATQPATQPTLTHTIQVFSDGTYRAN